MILCGQPAGRRTAALRLLLDLCSPGRLHDLTPAWEQPRVSLLPPMQPEHGYILDMTESRRNDRRTSSGRVFSTGPGKT